MATIPAGYGYEPPVEREGLSPFEQFLQMLAERDAGRVPAPGYDQTMVGAQPNMAAYGPGPDQTELARLQSRGEVMGATNAAPSLRDTYAPEDPRGTLSGTIGGAPPMDPQQGIPSGVPAPGTGYIQGPDGRVTFLGGAPGEPQAEGQSQAGIPAWAQPLQTKRYRRPGQADLEVVSVAGGPTSLRTIALADKVAPAFKDQNALRQWVEQTTGEQLPEGFQPQHFRDEARTERTTQTQAAELQAKANATIEKQRQESLGVEKAYNGAMSAFNERMKVTNNLMANPSGVYGITGQIYGQDIPEWMRFSNDSRRALADYEQAQAQTFLQALEQLKNASKGGSTGLGQLTEVEGKKIQTAVAALKRTQSTKDFYAKIFAYQNQLLESQRLIRAHYLANSYGFNNTRQMRDAAQQEAARRAAARGGGG